MLAAGGGVTRKGAAEYVKSIVRFTAPVTAVPVGAGLADAPLLFDRPVPVPPAVVLADSTRSAVRCWSVRVAAWVTNATSVALSCVPAGLGARSSTCAARTMATAAATAIIQVTAKLAMDGRSGPRSRPAARSYGYASRDG